jgi:hypothetical protein
VLKGIIYLRPILLQMLFLFSVVLDSCANALYFTFVRKLECEFFMLFLDEMISDCLTEVLQCMFCNLLLTFKYNLQINKIITSLGRTDRQKKLTTTTEATKTKSQSSRIIYIALI